VKKRAVLWMAAVYLIAAISLVTGNYSIMGVCTALFFVYCIITALKGILREGGKKMNPDFIITVFGFDGQILHHGSVYGDSDDVEREAKNHLARPVVDKVAVIPFRQEVEV
jgi:hypothetical protein